MKKYLEKKQPEQKAQSRCLAIHASARSSQESIEHIQVPSLYEIDHSKLPPTAPEKLQSIRVSETTLLDVSVKFPSPRSLHTHYENLDGSILPQLDEMYVMGPAIASEVLYRSIPLREVEEQSKTRSFWEVRRRFANPKSPSSPWLGGGPSPCWLSEFNLSGMVQCVKRKPVRFHTRHESPSSSGTDEEEETEMDQEEEEDDKAQEESPYELTKRKKPQKKPKTAKRPEQNNQIVVCNRSEKKLPSTFRWPEERYKLAQENIQKVMKAKRVSAENPILGAQLRAEVRKLSGDTGLIDHLLKHMAGEVTPGGADRFRRRRNANGVFEYWLESADLVSIRMEAGVEDPYWTPPPGWKIGDGPTQDPACARMFRQILEEMAYLKREMKSKQPEDLAIVTTSSSSPTRFDQGQANSSVIHEDKYTELAVKNSRIEEQMLQLSQSFSGIKEEMKSIREEMRVLKPTMEDSALVYSESAEVPLLVSDSGREIGSRDKASVENKAGHIERLRSSFRICKPQGTFLWPNVSMSPKGAVQKTKSFLVPTPPSVYSSHRLSTPNGHNLGSPLKTLAERRAVNISTLSNIVTPQSQIDSISVGKTHDINLNEFPDAYNIDSNAISGTLTYQAEQQNMVKARMEMEHDAGTRKDIMGLLGYSSKHQQRWCSSSSTTTSTP